MIRPSDIADLETLNAFDPFSGCREEDIREGRVFVYLAEGVVCGYICMARLGLLGRPYVQYIAVSPCCRSRGVASGLLDYTENKYANERLFISTESGNEPMRSLLLKREYTLTGEISGANLSGASELYYYKERRA